MAAIDFNQSHHMFPDSYAILNQQHFQQGPYTLLPIRFEDRLAIMQWRNEQLYHLRQAKPLTAADQERYFTQVVAKLFDQEQPTQLLFSFLKNDQCIGYGGLVHINWLDHYAELSFIMDTTLEQEQFTEIWSSYLPLIEQVAFGELNLHKVFTYAFDLRPHLYPMLEQNGYTREATLKEHCYFEGQYKDVVIHSKINRA